MALRYTGQGLPACAILSLNVEISPTGDPHIGGRFSVRLHLHWQALDWAQLVYALHGVMTVHAAGGLWVIPPHRAMWNGPSP